MDNYYSSIDFLHICNILYPMMKNKQMKPWKKHFMLAHIVAVSEQHVGVHGKPEPPRNPGPRNAAVHLVAQGDVGNCARTQDVEILRLVAHLPQ